MTIASKPAGPCTPSGRKNYINSLQPGQSLEDDVFLVSQKDLRKTARGDLYIHMGFVDRTGQVLARVWNATQQMYDIIPEGGFIGIRGRVESYKGNLQVIVEAIRPVPKEQVDLSDFLPRTRHNIDDMWERCLKVLRTIRDPQLLALMKAFVTDERIVDGFKRAPAAIQNHHAYIGGLLEHTCSLLELSTRVLGITDDSESHYPDISRDLVLAGIFLHDIGKVCELTYSTNFTYSTEGQLVGHITTAAIWLDRKIAQVEAETGQPFQIDVRHVLMHIILSHHGTYEFGSPRLPACPEAILVHYLDNIDAKLNMALTAMAADANEGGDWTDYVRALETRVFKKDVMNLRKQGGGPA